MRIAQISTVSAPVGPDSAGSVESLTWLLTRELARLGHEVTVFGTAGSVADGAVTVTLPGPYGARGGMDDWHLCEWVNLSRALEKAGSFDVLHSHAYLWGIPLQRWIRVPMVHTMHIVPDDNAAYLWRQWPGSTVTALSRHQWSAYPDLRPAAIIPHGLDMTRFDCRETPEDYLCYLGRFTSGKGPLHAIRTARALGMRLLLAGPDSPYFREKIQPEVDGHGIEYVGFVRGEERNRLLGGARALLYPIQFPESYGLVLAEAMLCGTPVAALGLGAVPEIVDEGVTGCVAARMEDFPQAVTSALALDRLEVRCRAETRFSAGRMARDYLSVYEQAAASSPVDFP